MNSTYCPTRFIPGGYSGFFFWCIRVPLRSYPSLDSQSGVYNDGSVTHTDSETNAWWQVDLGANYKINDINIFGRSDTKYASRLSDYTLYVIASNGSTTFSQDFTEDTFPSTNRNKKFSLVGKDITINNKRVSSSSQGPVKESLTKASSSPSSVLSSKIDDHAPNMLSFADLSMEKV